MEEQIARQRIVEIGRRMYDRRYVASNDGNISVKLDENTVLTTPTGISKGFLQEHMLVKVDMEGKVLEGTMKPSSELKMHLRVYRENPKVGAVVHAHPVTATAFAVAGISLEEPILTEIVAGLGPVPLAPYALPGSEEVPESIAPFCKNYQGCLLANHGALTWGEDLKRAYYHMESLEHYAMILLQTSYIIKKVIPLDEKKIKKLQEIARKVST